MGHLILLLVTTAIGLIGLHRLNTAAEKAGNTPPNRPPPWE